MNSLSNIAIGSQTKISSSCLSVSDKTIEIIVSDYIPKVSQEPDSFEFGDYSNKDTAKTHLVLVNGKLFEVTKNQVQQEGFTSDVGLFKTS